MLTSQNNLSLLCLAFLKVGLGLEKHQGVVCNDTTPGSNSQMAIR